MQLIINNSYSQIEGLSTKQYSDLRHLMSYAPAKNYAYSQTFNSRKYLIDKKGHFPTGLLPILQEYFKSAKYTTIDLRAQPSGMANLPVPKPSFTPYDDQIRAAIAACKHHRGIISMPTGTGKSMVIRLIASSLKVKTLVIVPTVELKKQLSEDLSNLPWVTVENIDSNALNSPTSYDCLILDEFHHAASKTYQKLNKTQWKGIYYRFGLTATPWRTNEDENILLEAILGGVIFKLSYKDAIKKGYIVPVEAYYYDLPKKQTNAYSYAQVYSELIVNNQERNELITTLMHNLHGAKLSTLCLVKEIKHGENLTELSHLPFANGKDDETRGFIDMFNRQRMPVLIGTSGILGEGIDTRPCEYVIIADLGKAKGQFMQKIGRAVRKFGDKQSAKIIIFRDSSHRFLLKHFNAQKKILVDEFNVKVVRLNN